MGRVALKCPSVLYLPNGQKLRGLVLVNYRAYEPEPKNAAWRMRKGDKRKYLIREYGEKRYAAYEKAQRRMDCNSPRMEATMRANIPRILDLGRNAATIKKLKVSLGSHFKGPDGHYIITCNIDVFWSNGNVDYGYSFNEWTNRYGQKRVDYVPPGVNGLPY